MFKLTALLCVSMFLILMIGGEDRGQLRPGLAMAAVEAAENPAPAAPDAPEIVLAAAEPALAPADIAPVATPVVVEQATAPVENATDPVFSLATYSDDAAPVTDTAPSEAPADSTLAYVNGRSVNVREGPGKENPVLAKLSRGEAVTVVWQDDTGWTRVRIEGDGLEGYVSTDLLSATAP
jgi:Bacterial SH3 domain